MNIFSKFGVVLKIKLNSKQPNENSNDDGDDSDYGFICFAGANAAARAVKYLSDFNRRVKICNTLKKSVDNRTVPLPNFYVKNCRGSIVNT